MRKIFIVMLLISISMSSIYAAENIGKSLLESIDINKYWKEETQKRIDKYYKDVIGELGVFYGHYKIIRYEMSKKTDIENLFGRVSGGKNYKYMRFYKASLQRTANLLTKVAWPDSYKVGGSIRREQINNMKRVLPDQYSSEVSFSSSMLTSLDLAFPYKPDGFYFEAMDEIKKIGKRFFSIEKDSIE